MTKLVAIRGHSLGDRPQRLSLSPQRNYFANRLLLGFVRDQLATRAAPVAS